MLPTLPADKANHLIYGALAWLAVVAGFAAAGWPYRIHAGLVAAAAVGLAKEAWDHYRVTHRGEVRGVELADALWTAAGGVLMTSAAVLVVAR